MLKAHTVCLSCSATNSARHSVPTSYVRISLQAASQPEGRKKKEERSLRKRRTTRRLLRNPAAASRSRRHRLSPAAYAVFLLLHSAPASYVTLAERGSFFSLLLTHYVYSQSGHVQQRGSIVTNYMHIQPSSCSCVSRQVRWELGFPANGQPECGVSRRAKLGADLCSSSIPHVVHTYARAADYIWPVDYILSPSPPPIDKTRRRNILPWSLLIS